MLFICCSPFAVENIKKRNWIFEKEVSYFRRIICVCGAQGVAIINFDEIYKFYQKPFLRGNQIRDDRLDQISESFDACAHALTHIKKTKMSLFLLQNDFKRERRKNKKQMSEWKRQYHKKNVGYLLSVRSFGRAHFNDQN